LRELCFYIFRENREELTFVLIGALGSGKSSTGNSILGHKHFKVSTGTMPVTETVQKGFVDRKGLQITVVDTPGLENVSSFTSIKHEIDEMLHSNKPTNIIYLITIKIGRYTKEERDILSQ
jgi:predicted GTPase